MKPIRRLRALFRREKLDAEMAEEMRAHLELQAAENEKREMSPEEARYAARRQFGGVEQIKEIAREQRGWFWLEQVGADFRHAARGLRKAPGFTFAVVATLAVGIGLVTGVVNVATPMLLPRFPFSEPERLVLLREKSPTYEGFAGVIPSRFADYAAQASVFSAFGAEKFDTVNLVVRDDLHAVRVSQVTAGFLPALGVPCVLGRLFAPDEYLAAHEGGSVVLSHPAWTKYFGRDPAIVGQDIVLGDRLRRVIGVLAPGFKAAPTAFQGDGIYLAASLEPPPQRLTTMSIVNPIGRLKLGVSLAEAEVQLRTIRPQLPAGSPESFAKLVPVLTTLPDVFREGRAQRFRIFLLAAGALYLIGCTTVANLMVSRAVGRRREFGVRLALGGTSGRLAGLIVTEALVLALLGAAGGILLATWTQHAMAGLLPAGVADLSQPAIGRTVALALGLGIPTCLLAAIVPAWRVSRGLLADALKEGSGSLGDSRRLRFLRGTFVVIQCTLATALLTGAGLMIRTVARLQQIDLGFEPAHKLVIQGKRSARIERARLEALNVAVAERLAALPGVEHSALTSSVPGGGGAMEMTSVNFESDSEATSATRFAVGPDYFDTVETKIVAGPGFAGLRPGDRDVAMIDEITARAKFPRGDAVGRFVTVGNKRLEIVGVVGNVATGWRGMRAITTGRGAVTAQFYTPVWQSAPSPLGVNAILRLRQTPGPAFAAEVRRAVHAVDPTLVVTLLSLEDIIDEWSRTERQTLIMLQVLSALALGLAVFGTFSVMAYAVARRQAEFGLRMALGATPRQLLAFVLRQGMALGAGGVGVGLLAAAALGGVMRALLFETSPHDVRVYAAVAAVLLLATFGAVWVPARRAAKVDPVSVLRCE